MDLEYLSSLETDIDNSREIPIIYHEGDWANYSSIVLMMPEMDFGKTLLMNTYDPSVNSAFRGFAFDLTLIANGGDVLYFPAWEEGFIVRYSRQIFFNCRIAATSGMYLVLENGITCEKANQS